MGWRLTAGRTKVLIKRRRKEFKMGGKLSALDPMQVEVPNLKELLDRDPYLRPYEREFRRR